MKHVLNLLARTRQAEPSPAVRDLLDEIIRLWRVFLVHTERRAASLGAPSPASERELRYQCYVE